MKYQSQKPEATNGGAGLPAAADAGRRATPQEERHWFLQQYESDRSSQNCSVVAELRGRVSPERVANAMADVLSHHPELFSRFDAERGHLRVRPSGGGRPEIRISRADSEAELRDALDAAQRRFFDLAAGDTCSVDLVQLDQRLLICLVVHGCVADRTSLEILLLELAQALGWSPNGSGISPPDRDRRCEEASVEPSQRDEVYWRQRMGAEVTPLDLPALAPRLPRKRYGAGRCTIEVPEAVAQRIGSFSAHSAHLDRPDYVLYLAAFLATLRRWSHQDFLTVGREVELRSRRYSGIGCLTDMVPLRVDFQPGMTLPSLADRVASLLAEDSAHATVSFMRLTQLLQVERDPSRHPVYQVAFRHVDSRLDIRTSDWALTEAGGYERAKTPCDVELWVDTSGPAHTVTALFDEVLYDERMMRQLLRHCMNLLERADEPAGIDSVDILDADERANLLRLSRGGDEALTHSTVHAMYTESLQRFPEVTAVVHGKSSLTHRELEDLGNRIATYLAGAGAGPGSCIGICMDRSIEMIATVLGVLKAGAAYVPMDPMYPEDRLRVMLDDSSVALVVAHRVHAHRLPSGAAVTLYEDLEQRLPEASPEPGAGPVSGEDLAYVIFTSGSTGRPKGVAMPHRALVNLIDWQLGRRPFISSARVLQYSSLSFDVSFQEIFTTLISGGTLHLIADSERRDPRRLLDALLEQQIQRLFLPYVALRQLVEVANATRRYPPALEEVITAGEQLRVDDALRDFFRRLPGASLDNQYGPSETHVVTAHMLTGDPSEWPALPPIGRPIRNNQTLILDDHGSLVPLGVQGELYLAGVNVARGYVGRDDLTRERFVPHELVSGPAYRTGDAVRYLRDGSIEFLGRTDFQVKIRGHRIEPNEVNAVLGRVPAVKQSLTKAVDDTHAGTRLVSYVLVDDAAGFDSETAFRKLADVLPEYMIPSAIVPLTELPFTPSGKVDLRALPVPDAPSRASRRLTLPRSTTEAELAAIWRRILRLGEVGVEESFFDVGGDSLLAVQLFLEIEQRFGLDLPLSVLVECPTIAALARVVDTDAADDLAGYRALRRIQRGAPGVTPLFLVHGGGGNVVLFGPLARAISPDLPVYAFQWDGWSGERGRSTIEQMAELYVEELLRFQNHGPYRLGGHCIGGLIALEMVRRLRQRGYEVIDPVLVTDAPNLSATTYRATMPGEASPEHSAMEALRQELRRVLSDCPPDSVSDEVSYQTPPHHRSKARRLVVRHLRPIYEAVSGRKLRALRVNLALDKAALLTCRLIGRRVPMKYRHLYASRVINRAAREYHPPAYDGPVVYFRTRLFLGEELGLSGWWEDLCLGFDELCRGDLQVHFVNATHNGVVQHPTTAQIIRKLVER